MSAELIIEDGTGIANANSYVTYEDAVTYAEDRNKDVNLFIDEDATTGWLVTAMDYLQSIINYQGLTSYTDQFLLWPRTGVYIDNNLLDKFSIPSQLKAAQIELALAQAGGINLFVNYQGTERLVKRKKVDVLETEYFEPINTGYVSIPYVDNLLQVLRLNSNTLRTLRV